MSRQQPRARGGTKPHPPQKNRSQALPIGLTNSLPGSPNAKNESGDTMEDLANMTNASHNASNPGRGTGTSNASIAKSHKGGKSRYDELESDLREVIGAMGLGLYAIPRVSNDGAVLLTHAESLSAKLVALSKKHVEVYRVLKAVTTSSVYGALVVEVGAIMLAIAANHGVNLPGMPTQAPDETTEQVGDMIAA